MDMDDDGKYNITAVPSDGKTWREAKAIDIVIRLTVGDELRIFKGMVPINEIKKLLGG